MSDLTIRNFGESKPTDGGEEYLDFSQPEGGAPEEQQIETDLEEPAGELVQPNQENNGDDELPEEKSSLTPPISEPPVQEEVKVTFDDESVLQYLNEKLGRQVTSFEELSQVKVENPLDSDPYLKNLYEWRQKTGRPIEDWYKYQKDYSSLSDVEAARELLQYEYPTFTPDEIELELERFRPDDLDDDRDAALKNLELKKLATRGRDVLSKLKSELGEPTGNLNPEIQEDLNLAKAVKETYAKEQQEKKDYSDNIKLSSSKTENFEIKLNDDLAINFKIPEEGKRELPTLIDTMPHWRNEDGSWNHQAVVNDAIKIKYCDQMLKLAYEQGVNSGEDKIIKEAKNTNFNASDPIAQQNNNKNKVEIEGLDDYLGNKGVKMRF